MRTMKKGFTLIELLVVVAIIGILAAVGTPIFQGFLADAKVNATTENHNRAKDMIAAYSAKCATSSTIKLGTTVVSCNATDFKNKFVPYFNANEWKNPHTKLGCCSISGTPSKGATVITSSGSTITIRSDTFKDNKATYVTNTVTME